MRPPGSGCTRDSLQPLVGRRRQPRIEEELRFGVPRRRADEALNVPGATEHKFVVPSKVLCDLVNSSPRHNVICRARDEVLIAIHARYIDGRAQDPERARL